MKIRLTFALLCFGMLSLSAQQTVSGTVTDPIGSPLPGVNVVDKATNTGAVTDFDGNYAIEVGNEGVLTFSYIGFTSQDIPVDGRTQMVWKDKAGIGDRPRFRFLGHNAHLFENYGGRNAR